jgi:hypothetical protein
LGFSTGRLGPLTIYYEEPDLSGGIEGIDYIIEYRVNSENIDEEA